MSFYSKWQKVVTIEPNETVKNINGFFSSQGMFQSQQFVMANIFRFNGFADTCTSYMVANCGNILPESNMSCVGTNL